MFLSRILLVGAAVALSATASPAHAGGVSENCIADHEAGLAAEEASKLGEAREAYSRCAVAACPAVIREECVVQVEAVTRAQPSVVVGVRAADGSDVVVTQLFIDGDEVQKARSGRPWAVDPGPHRIEARTARGTRAVDVVILQGEKNRTITIRLEEPPSAGDRDGPVSSSTTIHPSTWVAAGIGGAGLAVFAVAGGLGFAQEQSLDDCRPQCTQRAVDVMRERYLVSDIGLAVGAVGVVTAVVLGITLRSDDVETTIGPQAAHLRVRS